MSDTKGVGFLFLPPEHDPDSYVREFGPEAFDALVINPFTDNIVLTKEILTTMGLIEGEE